MRALAALIVYVYHVWQFCGSPALSIGLGGYSFALSEIIERFTAGVDLFMVLSGFCLFWPIAKNPDRAASWSNREYAMRRARRIIPPYYFSILFVTLLPVVLVIVYRALGQPAKWQPLPDWDQYVTHLLFIHTLFPSTWDGIQGVYWSLGLEAQFYLVFPLVVWGFRRIGIYIAIMMIALSFGYRVCVGLFTANQPWDIGFLWSITFLGRWMEFAAGMGAAWIVARRLENGSMSSGRGTLLLAFSVACYVAATHFAVLTHPALVLTDILLSLAFGSALVALTASDSPCRRLFEFRLVTWIGVMSYSLFLIHQNLAFYISEGIERVLGIDGGSEFILMITAVLVFVVAVSYVFHRIFEAPFMQAPLHKARRAAVVEVPTLSAAS